MHLLNLAVRSTYPTISECVGARREHEEDIFLEHLNLGTLAEVHGIRTNLVRTDQHDANVNNI